MYNVFKIITVLIFAGTSNAWAFKLSPCMRVLSLENGKLSQQKIRWLKNQCDKVVAKKDLQAVHEHMTLGAFLEYRANVPLKKTRYGWKYQYMIEPDWSKKKGAPIHASHAIIFGTWWNDDPLMRTWGQGLNFIGGSLADLKILNDGRSTYPGGTKNCSVPANVHLGRLSHFGELQHLHFMTNLKMKDSTPEERVKSTTDKAINWMSFAYKVAIGSLKPEQTLTPEIERDVSFPSIARNHCVSDSKNAKIRTIFSRIGQSESYRNQITPDVALGSMLHVIQDSFSPSHACRILETGSQQAVLADVKNYNEQNSDNHGSFDVYPQWLIQYANERKHLYENDPVAVGAWLLKAVDEKLPWEQVEVHLRNTIFAHQKSIDMTSNKSEFSCIK